MRTVSACQIVSGDLGSFEAAKEIVEAWVADKFDETGLVPIIRRSGKEAVFTRATNQIGGSTRTIYETEEEVEGGTLVTTLTLLSTLQRVYMSSKQSVRSQTLTTPHVQLALPRFVGEIISACPGCQAAEGGDALFRKLFEVNDRSSEEFCCLVFSDVRVLPVIAVSELNGQALTRDFPHRLAERIAGLAHVCLLSSDASWSLTQNFGKEWSAYNGAVKLYWPGAEKAESAKRHPLWTYDRLAERHATDHQAAAWLEQRLREVVFEASAYTSEAPAFSRFDQDLRQDQIKSQIRSAQDSGGYKELADSYAADNEVLSADITRLNAEISSLKAKLWLAHTSPEIAGDSKSVEQDESPPTTVLEAIDLAKGTLSGELNFPDELESLSALSPTAGPPEKVLRYLRVLSQMGAHLRSGQPLGTTPEKWFQERGVVCSGESETVLGSKKEQTQRTWSCGGKRVTCNLHLKPSDSTSPDRCIRIYFALPVDGKVPIGYIGRHF